MPSEGIRSLIQSVVVSGLNERLGLEELCLGTDEDYEVDEEHERLVSPLQKSYKPQVLQFYPPHSLPASIDHEAVNWLCFPQGLSLYETPPQDETNFHPFVITKEDGSRLFAAALIYYEKVQSADIGRDLDDRCRRFHVELERRNGRLSSYTNIKQLVVSKAICLVLTEPFNRSAHAILLKMYDLIRTPSRQLPLDCVIYNTLYEIPYPTPGRSVQHYVDKNSHVFYRPRDTELSTLDYCLYDLLSYIDVDNLLNVFKCVLLEQRVLVRSNHYYRLMLVCECLTALIFPFSWAHVYVPILPAASRHFLDAPLPYIMGLKLTDLDTEDETCEACMIDVDTGSVDLPEELPPLPFYDELRGEIIKICQKFQLEIPTRCNNSKTELVGIPVSSIKRSSSIDPTASLDNQYSALDDSDALKQLEAIMGKTGVKSTIQDFINEENKQKQQELLQEKQLRKQQQVLDLMKFSACVREVFLSYMYNLFRDYEKFVIYPSQCDLESWLAGREMMQNFDKEAFLGDQPALALTFLSQFLETQMFATFIDNKIMSQWQDPERGIKVFDSRNKVRSDDDSSDSDRKSDYERSDQIDLIAALVEKRFSQPDYVALAPHSLDILDLEALKDRQPGVFPHIDHSIFTETRPEDSLESESSGSDTAGSRARSPVPGEKTLLNRHTSINVPLDRKVDHVNEAFLQFIQSLLKECKVKTKRMLVGKMGEEAVKLGHGDPGLLGLEENTMIASLCDLIERIWSHGLLHKQSKSPFWAHLKAYSDLRELHHLSQKVDTFTTKPDSGVTAALFAAGLKLLNDFTAPPIETDAPPLDSSMDRVKLTHQRKGSYPERIHTIQPLTDSLITDINHIKGMSEVHTDVGRARAFIRLSLEKKVLAKRMKELIANDELLRSLYKRSAFLRSEDEREQALYHLLSLNTADYQCFTKAFSSSLIQYRVLIYPGKTFAGGWSRTTANIWISVAGQHRDSDRRWLPKTCLDFTFENKNLGSLSTVRIGHDNSGMAPKWLVDCVVVRNETTGEAVRFVCGRWLGRGVDDDSTERILVGEVISPEFDVERSFQDSPRRLNSSPQTSRRPNQTKKNKTQIQQILSDSVNNLLKYFHKPEKERESVTILLCGESGLVSALDSMLSMGFKSSRLFRSNLYIWDYLERVQQQLLEHDTTVCRSLLASISIINNSLSDVGKDGKLQILLCISIRDHLLPEWLTYLHKCPITKQMYDSSSFLLDEPQIQFLVNLLSTLRMYHIQLEPSITKGLDI